MYGYERIWTHGAEVELSIRIVAEIRRRQIAAISDCCLLYHYISISKVIVTCSTGTIVIAHLFCFFLYIYLVRFLDQHLG